MSVHKTVNGAYRYRYAPFLMPTYYVTRCSPLVLPLVELSPQVTERGLQPFSNDKINLHITEIPVDIPVGESQKLRPRRHQKLRTFSSVLAALGHLSQMERQGMLARYTERCIEVRPSFLSWSICFNCNSPITLSPSMIANSLREAACVGRRVSRPVCRHLQICNCLHRAQRAAPLRFFAAQCFFPSTARWSTTQAAYKSAASSAARTKSLVSV